MAMYMYTGLDAGGNEQHGRIEAENEKEVVQTLRERSIFVIKVSESSEADSEETQLGRMTGYFSITRFMPVKTVDLIPFYQQIALMLRAGFTLIEALEASIGMQSKHGLLKIIKRVCDEIRRGTTFSVSLEKNKNIFSSMTINLIASGEKSGNLDVILERIAESIEINKELKRQLMAAMFYPMFVLMASVGLIIVLVIYVIPRFSTFLTARKATLPESTQLLMDISDWALRWGGAFAVILGIATFITLALYTTKPGKHVIDKIILKLPLIGNTIILAAMAQAGWSMSMLLKSGLTALESLRITGRGIGNLAVGSCFIKAAKGLLMGKSLSKTFEQRQIPLMMRQMAAVGEKSGQLDMVMHEVGKFYQKELVAKLKFITVIIEPVLILGAGSVVMFVYYALFQAVMAVSKGGM